MASSILEEKIVTIINSEAPITTQQMRTRYHNWITDATKHEMEQRDTARNISKDTDLDEDWNNYKTRRNLCTSLQRKDKISYYKSLYTKMEENNDSKKLFATTKQLLGNIPTGPPTEFLINGKLVRKQQQLADAQA